MGMEFDGVLDPDNENHIFCLHEVYKPTINNMLNRFTNSWQNHKLRTARNKSPLQLFIMGMQQIGRETGVIPNEYFETLNEVSVKYSYLDLALVHVHYSQLSFIKLMLHGTI